MVVTLNCTARGIDHESYLLFKLGGGHESGFGGAHFCPDNVSKRFCATRDLFNMFHKNSDVAGSEASRIHRALERTRSFASSRISSRRLRKSSGVYADNRRRPASAKVRRSFSSVQRR